MKILKKFLLILIFLLGIILITGLFVSNQIYVEKEITIEKNKDSVFEFVRYLKNQDKYGVWNKMDPNMKKTYTGTDGEPGFVSCWESKNENVGKGCQKITSIVQGKRADVELTFHEPFESVYHAWLQVEPRGNSSCRMLWGIEGKIPYPMNVMCLFIDFDGLMGKDLEEGLKNLKVYIENTKGM